MILLVSGASHTGKTVLAQTLLERHGYPYLSLDHLKMGLIRSGQTTLSPESPDAELTSLLWPIAREMIKTAIENDQNLIVEGCYIPFCWRNDFTARYLKEIRYLCLIMDQGYIRANWAKIIAHASAIERRLDDSLLSPRMLEKDNAEYLKGCSAYGLKYLLIRNEYPERIDLEDFGD